MCPKKTPRSRGRGRLAPKTQQEDKTEVEIVCKDGEAPEVTETHKTEIEIACKNGETPEITDTMYSS